jgi:hypothetical protein
MDARSPAKEFIHRGFGKATKFFAAAASINT